MSELEHSQCISLYFFETIKLKNLKNFRNHSVRYTSSIFSQQIIEHIYSSWLALSKLQGSPLEERLQGKNPYQRLHILRMIYSGSSWQPRLLASLLLQLEELRSPTVTGLAQSPSGRSEGKEMMALTTSRH